MTMQAWSSFSELLRTYRRNKHWSQEQLAEYLDYSYEAISAWERNKRFPNRHELPRLAKLLEVETDVLTQYLEASRKQREKTSLASVPSNALPHTLPTDIPAEVHALWHTIQHVDPARRDFFLHVLVMLSTAMAGLPYEPLSPYSLDRLVDVLAHGKRVDEATLIDLEAITAQYWDIFRRTPIKSDLLSGALGFFGTIIQFLHDSLPPKTRQRLCSAASDVSQIVGDIFFDMHLYTEAETYYQSALSLAQQGGSDVLWAVGLGRMSFLPIYKGEAHKALPLLEEAQQTASLSCAKLSWLAMVEAEARALVGDLSACEQALGRAEHQIGQCEAGQDGGVVRIEYSRLLGYKGVCYLRLGQPPVAQRVLEESLTLLDTNPATLHRRVIIFTDLCTASIQQGHLEQGCHFAQQALAKVEQIRSAQKLQRVLSLRHDLEPWKDEHAVKTLDEQIAAVKKIVG